MTTSYSALSPASAALYTALNVSAVTTLATGGVGDDIAQKTGYPFVLFVVSDAPAGGLGSRPGRSGHLPVIDLRVHAFSQYEGGKEAQSVCEAAIGALTLAFDPDSPTVTIAGYKTCGLFWDSTSEPFDSIVAGLKVKEVVAQCRLFVELS